MRGLTPPSVVISRGQSVTRVRIALERGTHLEVRVKDSKKLVPSPARPIAGAVLAAEVASENRMTHNARLLANDAEGTDYAIVVSKRKNLRLAISGSNHKWVDDKGQALASDSPKLQIKDGDKENKIRVEVQVDEKVGGEVGWRWPAISSKRLARTETVPAEPRCGRAAQWVVLFYGIQIVVPPRCYCATVPTLFAESQFGNRVRLDYSRPEPGCRYRHEPICLDKSATFELEGYE